MFFGSQNNTAYCRVPCRVLIMTKVTYTVYRCTYTSEIQVSLGRGLSLSVWIRKSNTNNETLSNFELSTTLLESLEYITWIWKSELTTRASSDWRLQRNMTSPRPFGIPNLDTNPPTLVHAERRAHSFVTAAILSNFQIKNEPRKSNSRKFPLKLNLCFTSRG